MKTKNKPFRSKNLPLQPDKIETFPLKEQVSTGVVKMSNRRTGRVVHMGAKAAIMLSTKYPNEFKIL